MRQNLSRALVADSHALSAFGISDIIQHLVGRMQVSLLADYCSVVAALRGDDQFDIVTVDLSLPGMEGLLGLGRLREICGASRLVVVSSESDRSAVLGALASGVHGFITKDMSAADIAEAFRLVIAGHIYVPHGLAELPSPGRDEKVPARFKREKLLTLRQRDVMVHLRRGASNKEIARSLGISESTVKVHMAAAFRILGVNNRVGAVNALFKLSHESQMFAGQVPGLNGTVSMAG